MEINIVILGYNRKPSLERLIKSIDANVYDGIINLYLSVDGGGSEVVKNYAQQLNWQRGRYEYIQQQEALGVDAHNLWAFEFGSNLDGVLILEDDLTLSPYAMEYIRSCEGVLRQENVKGLSLYRYTFREEDHFPFELIPNDEFIYYQQRSSSKGCYYSAQNLKEYLSWDGTLSDVDLPKNVASWGDEVWEKSYYRYLIEEDAYLAFPRYSLSTDHGEIGVHMKKEINTYIHHTPLYLSNQFSSKSLEKTLNCYDAFYEVIAGNLEIEGVKTKDLSIDLYGTKPLDEIKTEFVITSKECSNPIKQWGRKLKPEVNNILLNQEGEFYSLCKVSDCIPKAKHARLKENFLYYYPDTRIIDLIKMKWSEIISRF